MSTKRQKEQKKKNREREAYTKVLKRRETLRLQRKIAESEERQRQEIEDLSHGKSKPIIRDADKSFEMEVAKTQTVSERLKKNLEILEALEQEYEQEHSNRVEVNEKLESEGFISIKEKMDALHQKALEMTGKSELLAEAYANQENEMVAQP